MTDWAAVRSEFPALEPRDGVGPPAYLDSACMSLVPRAVLAAMEEYYREYPGCAGRSLHRFAEEVGHRYESARETFARFLGAADPAGIVFLRNATEAINLVGQGIGWNRGDRVVITDQEHNSNLVLWQRLARERGIVVEILDLPDGGGFDRPALERVLARPVRLVSLFQTSNLDGRSLPIREIAEAAHAAGGELLVDGCQAAPHERVDLGRLGADYYALSLHKMLGPSGTGLLASTPEVLARLRPLIVGGETVEWTTLTDHALRPPPHRFEAGLQNYAGVLGATAGVEMLERVGRDAVRSHDADLNARATSGLAGEPRIRILGPASPADRPSILAFSIDGIDPHDAALFLDTGHRVLVRSGRHCVHSWYDRRGLVGNVRASFYLYNTNDDVDALVEGVRELIARLPETAARRVPGTRSTGTSASKRQAAAPRGPSRRRGAGS
ncbi:MAG TPA: aminotransferase class V-fold PLP-dependent enzyme [Thermoplasmata archaeon]|nr:aminotransferase class V-fold PLP-dependent enzyme [Thermoplasmata archaeon]